MELRVLAATLVAVLMCPGWLDAESQSPRRPKWWQDEGVKLELALTDRQSAEVEATFQASLPSLREQKRQLDGLEEALSRMIRERTADEAEVAQLIDRVEAARSGLSKERTLMLYRMHRILTPEQNEKLRKMTERRSRDRDSRDRRP
jgi:Spy/CpxP family protein refolding chaperone